MNFFSIILTILGLCLFETVSSVDNAVINAEVLGTMSPKGRRWFSVWGMLFAVFAVRGILPWLIVWLSTPGLGPIQAISASFSGDPSVLAAIEKASPLLLMAGGVFLVFLFLHWLFLEPKKFGLAGEKFFYANGVWFYAIVSAALSAIIWQSLKINPFLAFAAVIGSTTFFITHGFKENAASHEKELMQGGMSELSKVFYLEIIDATFSIDGVLGAFAFTLSVPLILLGNSLGAFLVRHITLSNIDSIKKYIYLKNGAMYSILFLGLIMLLDGFGVKIPQWVSPAITFVVIGYFYLKSKAYLKNEVVL
jgi:hypothetical protein